MSQEYAARYVREVLVKTKGNLKHAESVILELVKSDEQLLYGLTKPYLGGIVAHAIQRASKKQDLAKIPTQKDWEPKKKRASQYAPPSPKPMQKKAKAESSEKNVSSNSLDGLLAQLAKNIEGDGGKTQKGVMENKVSDRHIKSMRALATKDYSYRKQRKD
jgi:hypothetical protein